MGIVIASNFDVNTGLPIDSRLVVADLTARDAIATLRRYEGMLVYVVSEGTNYQLVGGTDNADWQELSGSGGGSNPPLVWRAVAGSEPFLENDFGMDAYNFVSGALQQIEAWHRVPASYSPGDQLFLKTPLYLTSPIVADGVALRLESFLVDITTQTLDDESVDNTYTETLTAGQANYLLEQMMEITDASGEIDTVAVAPGNLIKLRLTRVAALPAETDNDFKVVPSLTEVTT